MTRLLSPMGPVEWSLLVLLSLLWGGSFFFAKVALAEIPPLTLALLRVALAALVLAVLLRGFGLRLPAGIAAWRQLAVMGLLNNAIPFTLFFWGMTALASGLAAIINATTPLFTVLLAHVFTNDERLNGGKLTGVVLGLAGIVVLVGFDALDGLGVAVLAQLACLAGAFSYALSGIWGRRLSANPPMVNAAGQLSMSTLIMVPIVAVVDRPWTLSMPSATAVAAIVGLAVISTALAYVIFFRILATAGATNLLLVTLLIPVSALLLGVGLLGESLALNALVGMALIGAGLAAIDGRPAMALSRRWRAT